MFPKETRGRPAAARNALPPPFAAAAAAVESVRRAPEATATLLALPPKADAPREVVAANAAAKHARDAIFFVQFLRAFAGAILVFRRGR